MKPTNIVTFLAKSVIIRNSHRDAKYNEMSEELRDLKSQLEENICAGCGYFDKHASNLQQCIREECLASFCTDCFHNADDRYMKKTYDGPLCNACAATYCHICYHTGNLITCNICGLKVCDEFIGNLVCRDVCLRYYQIYGF